MEPILLASIDPASDLEPPAATLRTKEPEELKWDYVVRRLSMNTIPSTPSTMIMSNIFVLEAAEPKKTKKKTKKQTW